MYSGTSLTPVSGRLIGNHQKIDRVARRNLGLLVDHKKVFPSAHAILRFEGWKGPDAIKIKSPAQDEPWHYYSPFNDKDSQIIELITNHYDQLVISLKNKDQVRSSFEAAWLAHAIVDGLTPAHHYPYEAKLVELRGEGIESRDTIRKKVVIQGDTRSDTMQKNWKVWGPKGLITTHQLFEMGIATLSAPLSFTDSVPNPQEVKEMMDIGIVDFFQRRAREIAILDLYNLYYRKGWSLKLMISVRSKLIPTIIRTVTLVWYSALLDSGQIKKPKFNKS